MCRTTAERATKAVGCTDHAGCSASGGLSQSSGREVPSLAVAVMKVFKAGTVAREFDDSYMGPLLRQVRDLSQECFSEDCTKMCSVRGGYKINILHGCGGAESTVVVSDIYQLFGFITVKVNPTLKCLSIRNVAVPPTARRHGHGRKLVRWAITHARQLPEVHVVSLFSLPDAIEFYQRLGFRKKKMADSGDLDEDVSYVPGQIFMEYRLKGKMSVNRKRQTRR